MTAPIDQELFCPDCGYNLRGIASDRCPECGINLDRDQRVRSRIPWTYRRDIGRVRAYLRTVWLVIARPRTIADEVARPVDLQDARRFRSITILIALIPLIALATWGLIVQMHQFRDAMPVSAQPLPRPLTTAWIGWTLEYGFFPIAALAIYLFLRCITGVASYFFHPLSLSIVRQNRAVAVSYYACAPFALTPLSVAAFAQFAATLHYQLFAGKRVLLPLALLLAICVAIPMLQAVTMYTSPLRMLRRATQCSNAHLWLVALALPLTWAFLAALTLLAIPAAYYFICIVILSLTP